MADVKVCDRCGEIIRDTTYGINVKFADGMEKTLYTIGNSHIDFDLCQPCRESLVKWFNEGNPINEQ